MHIEHIGFLSRILIQVLNQRCVFKERSVVLLKQQYVPDMDKHISNFFDDTWRQRVQCAWLKVEECKSHVSIRTLSYFSKWKR